MSEKFQVDLSGMVDLLSHHLYSGPQVFIRELLQNAVDAIAARRELDPAAPATVRVSVTPDASGVPLLQITDTGVGLTAAEARELLSTIGRSSKRGPDLGLARSDFIGQFGIGLLAAFMVADRIEVVSSSARGAAPTTRWTGRADGTFDVDELEEQREPGTTVRLTARRGAEHWLAIETIVGLATEYAALLPVDIAVQVPVEGVGDLWRRITLPDLPWKTAYPSLTERTDALSRWCESTLGFTPLGHVDLDLPLLGLTGVAFILPQAVAPGSSQHRVYAKRMLVGPRVDGVLPDWAFFARAVLDTSALTPTASREQLHTDELLLATRDALGDRLKAWAAETLATPSTLARRFLETHHLALRALAVTDDDMLDLVARVVPFETTDGPQTLTAAASEGEVVYTTTTEAYRRVAAVARAQGLIVVNAGYVYDADLLTRLGKRGGWRTRELTTTDMVHVLELPDVAREAELGAVIVRARGILADQDTDVIVRQFEPEVVPAMLLRDSDGESRRELDRERDASPGLWGGLLDAFADTSAPAQKRRTRTLVLNDRADVVRQLLRAPEGQVFEAGLRSLYLSALMLAGDGLRSSEVVSLNDALGVLLASSLGETPSQDERSSS